MIIFFSSIFTLKGEPEAFICCVIKGSSKIPSLSGGAIADYGFALKCLADKGLRLVQNSGFILTVN
jgi:hypothetical protein